MRRRDEPIDGDVGSTGRSPRARAEPRLERPVAVDARIADLDAQANSVALLSRDSVASAASMAGVDCCGMPGAGFGGGIVLASGSPRCWQRTGPVRDCRVARGSEQYEADGGVVAASAAIGY